jgi:hypothetical protein
MGFRLGEGGYGQEVVEVGAGVAAGVTGLIRLKV